MIKNYKVESSSNESLKIGSFICLALAILNIIRVVIALSITSAPMPDAFTLFLMMMGPFIGLNFISDILVLAYNQSEHYSLSFDLDDEHIVYHMDGRIVKLFHRQPIRKLNDYFKVINDGSMVIPEFSGSHKENLKYTFKTKSGRNVTLTTNIQFYKHTDVNIDDELVVYNGQLCKTCLN